MQNENTNNETVETKTPEQIRIEELKAELAAEEAKVAEKARELRLQEEEAKRLARIERLKVANAPEIQKLDGYARELVNALAKKGVNITFKPAMTTQYGEIAPPVFNVNYPYITFEVRYVGGTKWSCGSKAGWKLWIGLHGDRKQFQNGKFGFKFEKIAQEYIDRLNARKARDERNAEKMANENSSQALANELLKSLGVDSFSSTCRIGTSAYYADKVDFSFKSALAPEQVILAVQALRSVGIEIK
jgi:hypothetical protein